MEVKDVTPETKEECLTTLKGMFGNIRKFLAALERDIESPDMKIQTSAIWVAGNFCEGYSGFIENLQKLDVKKEDRVNLEKEMMAANIL